MNCFPGHIEHSEPHRLADLAVRPNPVRATRAAAGAFPVRVRPNRASSRLLRGLSANSTVFGGAQGDSRWTPTDNANDSAERALNGSIYTTIRTGYLRPVTYEEFRAAFMEALRESKLPMIGRDPEEDMLTEMFGRDGALTERRRLRIDIKLNASLPWGKPLPMPSKAAWSAWACETLSRLEHIEPLTPRERLGDANDGELLVMARQGAPRAAVSCSRTGDLQLESVSVSAMQIMQFPRTLDDADDAPDAPEDQLKQMFHRVWASLMAWMQAVDHLKKTTVPSMPDRFH